MVDHQHPTDWLSSSKSASRDEGSASSWTRRHKTGLGLVFAGVVAGGVLAGTLGASAATGGTTPAEGASGYGLGYGAWAGPEGGHGGPPAGARGDHGPGRGDEKPLSASLTAGLKAKALVAVPGGTVDHVGSAHGDAVYVAHVTKSDGTKVRVEFDKDQKVLRVETDKWMGGPGKAGPGARPGGARHEGFNPEGFNPERGAPPAGGS